MAFVGKLAYLALFPGMLFLGLAGLMARSLMLTMSGLALGGSGRGPSLTVPGIVFKLRGESVAAGGSLRATMWLAPALKLPALSWAACLVLGFIRGDISLLFALLLVAGAADLLLCVSSANPRVRQNAPAEAWSMLAWSVPLALALVTVFLRTGSWTFPALVDWQVEYGILVGSSRGGAMAVTGTALALAGACFWMLGFARLRPVGRSFFSAPPGGMDSDLSGAPLALVCLGEGATLLAATLVLVALFLAGPASNWYEIVFWALKVLGVVIVAGVVDILFARSASRRAVLWVLCAGGALAAAGLALVWLGVRA